MNRIRAFLVGENNIVLAGLHALVEKMKARVVGLAEPDPTCLPLIHKLAPNLIAVYFETVRVPDLALLRQFRKEFPRTQVIVLSHFASHDSVIETVRTGVSGYLPLEAEPRELESCFRSVFLGQSYLSPRLSRHVLADYQPHGEPEEDHVKGPGRMLTARQIQVLQLVVRGRTSQEIAHDLRIGIKTVETHRANVMERLNIHDVPGLVRYAIRTGLIGAEQ